MVDKGTGNIHEVGFCRQCMESRLGPELATDQGEGVGEGGEGLEVPSRSAKRGDGRDLGMGEQRHQGKEAEQCRGRAGDRTVGPLALGLHAEVGADLAKRHFELPAQDKPGDDLQRIGGKIGAQQGLRGEFVARIADEHPANRDGRQPRVVPDGCGGEELNGPISLAVPARDGLGRPGGRRVVNVGREVGEPSADQAWSSCLPWTSW